MTFDMQRNGRTTKPQGLKELPLDARPRHARQERLAAWGLPGDVPCDRLPVPDDAARRGRDREVCRRTPPRVLGFSERV